MSGADPGRVAIIGVSGVGKEYARVLTALGRPFALCDFGGVLGRELEGYRLRNTFVGHEFTVALPLLTPIITVPDVPSHENLEEFVGMLLEAGITHVVHATPSTEEGRTLFHYLHTVHYGDFRHLVEKPYMSSVADWDVHVGYLYWGYKFTDLAVAIGAPAQGGWRWQMGDAPLLWDSLGHALSTFNDPNDMDKLHVLACGPDRFAADDWALLSSPSQSVYVRFIDGKTMAFNENGPLDWDGAFENRVMTFLTDSPLGCRAPVAIAIENQIRRLEKEMLDVRPVRASVQ